MRGQLAHKLLICIRLCAAELMIEMNYGEDDAQLWPQLEQNAQQADGIRSAGDGNAHAVPWPQQGVLADVVRDGLGEPVHGFILYRVVSRKLAFEGTEPHRVGAGRRGT